MFAGHKSGTWYLVTLHPVGEEGRVSVVEVEDEGFLDWSGGFGRTDGRGRRKILIGTPRSPDSVSVS